VRGRRKGGVRWQGLDRVAVGYDDGNDVMLRRGHVILSFGNARSCRSTWCMTYHGMVIMRSTIRPAFVLPDA
jgi:hypothetical protein